MVKTGASAAAAVSSHVLGAEDALALGKMLSNALLVLRSPCQSCAKVMRPQDEYRWAMIAVIAKDGTAMEDCIYVVDFDTIVFKKGEYTLDMGKDEGENRVSSLFQFELFAAFVFKNYFTKMSNFQFPI